MTTTANPIRNALFAVTGALLFSTVFLASVVGPAVTAIA